MRVGLVIYGSLDILSGGYLYDQQLVSHLESKGHPVEVVSLSKRTLAGNLLDNCSPRLLRALASAGADIWLQDGLCHPSLPWLNRRLRRQSAAPVVALVHQVLSARRDLSGRTSLKTKLEKRFFASVDGFICNSRTSRDFIRSGLGLKGPCLVATPGGDRLGRASTEEVTARCRDSGPLRLLFLGNVLPAKGLDGLIESLCMLPEDSVRLTVAGRLDLEPGHVQAVRKRLRETGRAGLVRLTGPLEGGELARTLRAHHVLALPFSQESFGIAYLEGLAFGLPALGSTLGAAKEIIVPGRNGELIPPGDLRFLADILRRLHEDRELLLSMSRRALEDFERHPTWQESLERARCFLEKMAGL
jgi:glycosyltransferase involved in cell wall biosynthesis